MHPVENWNIRCTKPERDVADLGLHRVEKSLRVHEFERCVVARVRLDHRHIRRVEHTECAREFDGQHHAHGSERMVRTEVVRREFIGPDDGQRMHEIHSSERTRALLASELARPIARRLERGQKRSPHAVVLQFADCRDRGACR